jgi:predicted RNA-binding protein
MCEANAYVIKETGEEMVMSSVDVVEQEEENCWRLVSIFGEQKTIRGKIRSMNLVDHKIMFEPLPG